MCLYTAVNNGYCYYYNLCSNRPRSQKKQDGQFFLILQKTLVRKLTRYVEL